MSDHWLLSQVSVLSRTSSSRVLGDGRVQPTEEVWFIGRDGEKDWVEFDVGAPEVVAHQVPQIAAE